MPGQAIPPADLDALYHAGFAHLEARRYGAAAEVLRDIVAHAPDAAAARGNFAKALFQLGRVDEAVRHFRTITRSADPAVAALARENLACIIPGSSADLADILRTRSEWADSVCPLLPPRPATRPADGRLRIGYLSAFFGAANWMKPMWGLINAHDRTRFQINMFSDGDDPSAASGYRDEPDDRIHVIGGVDNDHLADIIRAAGIDILVDLNGYSFLPRLPLLMRRPAPLIVGCFAMYATTGLRAVDWLVVDAVAVRPEEECHYPERIHRLPGSYLAFDVLYAVPPIVAPPCLINGSLTFGSLCSQYKLTDATLDAWAAILRAAPRTRLLVRNAALEDASVQADLRARLAERGVPTERVTLEGRAAHFTFLQTYDRIDVALDAFPYNGGTTTMEALWQGVPVLTFDGSTWAGRTSASLLVAAGLQKWVAADVPAYVAQAAALAHDPLTPSRLAEFRRTARERLRAAPVCDTVGMCRATEAFYETAFAEVAAACGETA